MLRPRHILARNYNISNLRRIDIIIRSSTLVYFSLCVLQCVSDEDED